MARWKHRDIHKIKSKKQDRRDDGPVLAERRRICSKAKASVFLSPKTVGPATKVVALKAALFVVKSSTLTTEE
jgi:hypothetical protein